MKMLKRKRSVADAKFDAWRCGGFLFLYGWVQGYPQLEKGEKYSDYPPGDATLLRRMRRIAEEIHQTRKTACDVAIEYFQRHALDNDNEARSMNEWMEDSVSWRTKPLEEELGALCRQWREREDKCKIVAEELMGAEG